MSTLFINYRRKDASGYAGRLYDRLAKHFDRDQVFMDIDQIEPGEDFHEVIDKKLKSVQVAVVLIGRHWLDITDAAGKRRLDNPDDWVRLEIAALLERNIRVIPVLVGDAVMPQSTELPECLKPLARRNAYEISDLRFHTDVDRLIQVLEKITNVQPSQSFWESSNVSEIVEDLQPSQPSSQLSETPKDNQELEPSQQSGHLSIPANHAPNEQDDEAQPVQPSSPSSSATTMVDDLQPSQSYQPSSQPLETLKDNHGLEQPLQQSYQPSKSTGDTKNEFPWFTAIAVTAGIGITVNILFNNSQETKYDDDTNSVYSDDWGATESSVPVLPIWRTTESSVPVLQIIEPEMVRIPAGTFLMGSPETEEGRSYNEGPQREVTIAYAFEMSKYEITFDEYDVFANVTNRNLPDDDLLGRGRRPVINISWHDAQAYVQWFQNKPVKSFVCRPKPNGNMLQGQAHRPAIGGVIILVTIMRIAMAAAVNGITDELHWLVHLNRIRLDFMTLQVMSGNGFRIAGAGTGTGAGINTTAMHLLMVPRG